MSKVTETVRSLAEPVAAGLGLEIWDVEYVKEAGSWYLRLYIDREGGVSIDDCEAFSRALDPLLDEADPIPTSYVFEVSSAGADRELKRPSDFERFIGSAVEVRHYQPIDGAKQHTGTLVGYENGSVTIMTPKGERTYNNAQVAQVRLSVTI